MAFLETFGLVTYASMGVWHAAVTKGLNTSDAPNMMLTINCFLSQDFFTENSPIYGQFDSFDSCQIPQYSTFT